MTSETPNLIIKNDMLCGKICNKLITGLTPRKVIRELINDEVDTARNLTIADIRYVGKYYGRYIREEKRKKAAEKEKERIKNEREARFQAMKAEGKPFEQIARETGESLQTVIRWGRCNKDEIKTYDAVRIESLRERFPVFKAQRIALLGEQIIRIREELAKRNLQDISTDKLFKTLVQLTKLLKDEEPVGTINI